MRVVNDTDRNPQSTQHSACANSFNPQHGRLVALNVGVPSPPNTEGKPRSTEAKGLAQGHTAGR